MATRLATLVSVLALLVCMAAGRPAAAQQPPAAGAAAIDGDDVVADPRAANDDQAADDQDEAEDKADKAEAFRKVMDQSRQYLLTVAIRWQKDEGELPDGGYEAFESSIGTLVENKQSSEDVGVMLDPAAGLIMAGDHGAESRFVEAVSGITAGGETFPLNRHGFYLGVDAAAYRTDKWPGPADPLAWVDEPADPFEVGGLVATLGRDRLGWRVTTSTFGGATSQRADMLGLEGLVGSGGRGLVFDDDGRPLGFCADSRISLSGSRYAWRGPDLLKARLMTLEQFDALKAEVETQVGGYAHEVRIVYRQPEADEQNLEFEGEDRASLTQYYYGYAVSPRRVFVPVKLEKIYIQRFKEISVRLGERDVPAKFLGAYLEFGGFVVEMEGATSPAVLPVGGPADVPDFNRAVMTYRHERKFGRRRNVVWYNRVQDYTRGYMDRLWPVMKHPMMRGTLVLDFDKRPIGLSLIERRLEQEKKGEDTRWRYYYRGRPEGLRLYRVDQLAAAFSDPEKHFDPNLKPASEQEEKRLVWLGVETQDLTARLAEMLDHMAASGLTQKWTRKGEIGLRVTHVYRDSPAAAAGIQVGDILLEVKETGKDKPIELEPSGGRGGFRGSMPWMMGRGGRSSGGDGAIDRRNYLTALLTRLGPGTEITLAYLQGTERKTHDFTLQWAPHDFESADKVKDEKTGLTVKNLTYDVRAMLRLDDDQPGVIVAKVEDGEKADIAQIVPYQIITELNGRPVSDVKDYETRMKAIQEADTGTAVFTLLWMGKSRIVRIEFP